jgi:very-short-patch-repair endonuclease
MFNAKHDDIVKWYKLPFNRKLKQRARELRKAGNLAEVLFWQQVKNKKIMNLDFDRQKIIGNYIVDFYCKNLGIIIEIDGSSHNNKQEYDKERDLYFKSLNLTIFHIQDIEVKKNMAGVLEYLRSNLTPRHLMDDTPLKEGNKNSPSLKGWQTKSDGVVKKCLSW